MKRFIVRTAQRGHNRGRRPGFDYIGTYAAKSAVAALSQAGRDPYRRIIARANDIYYTAVEE